MTSSYDRIVPNSKVHLLFQRLQMVREYKDTRTAPPPLNILFGVRGTFSLALVFALILSGGVVAQTYAWAYALPYLIRAGIGSTWAIFALHVSAWLTVVLEGLLVVIYVTKLHHISTCLKAVGRRSRCFGGLLRCAARLVNCRENHFCQTHAELSHRHRAGFSVSATPAMSRAVERKERIARQASLERSRAREAKTWEAQVSDVRDGQQRLEGRQ